MDSQLSSPVGERVYCHECESEWIRAQHGLQCPHCHSDFTEVLEHNNDPRHQPPSDGSEDDGDSEWEDAPDPDEDDIAHIHHPQARDNHSHNETSTFTFMMPRVATQDEDRGANLPRAAHDQTSDTPGASPIPQAFQTMLQGILGPVFGSNDQASTTPVRDESSHNPDPARSQHSPSPRFTTGSSTTVRTGTLPGVQWTVTTTRGSPAPGFGFLPPNHPEHVYEHVHNDNAHPQQDTAPPATSPLPALLNFVFGGPAAQGAGNPFGPRGPLAMFAGFGVDPANMRHGDAVYSQEALDRIITGLMEQHQSGSAPGPASQEAISSLNTRSISAQDLGTEGRAECSICMEEVNIGEQVTDLPCHHWFHGECVKAWLAEHDTCPHCRQSIMPKPSGPDDTDADRLRTPHEAPRHDLTLGSPLPTPGGDGTYANPWTIPDSSPLTSRHGQPAGQSASPNMSVGGDELFSRMRSAFGGSSAQAGASAHSTGQASGRDFEHPRPSSPD